MTDILFRLTSRDGWQTPDGDYRVLATAAGSMSWRRDGDDIHVEFQPALQVVRNGILGEFVRGNIRQAKLARESVTVWISDLPILGTIEREYKL